MRDLKFRVWAVKDKKWENPTSLEVFQTSGKLECLYKDQEYIIDQYTGLKDKNGKDIFEGDIVHRFFRCSLMPVPSIDDYQEIKWWTEGGRWNLIPCLDSSLEVVGNIHENPELLK